MIVTINNGGDLEVSLITEESGYDPMVVTDMCNQARALFRDVQAMVVESGEG